MVIVLHCALPTTFPTVPIIPCSEGPAPAEESPPAQGHISFKRRILVSLGPKLRIHIALSPFPEGPPWASFLGPL